MYNQVGYVAINQIALSMNVISPLINRDLCKVGRGEWALSTDTCVMEKWNGLSDGKAAWC